MVHGETSHHDSHAHSTQVLPETSASAAASDFKEQSFCAERPHNLIAGAAVDLSEQIKCVTLIERRISLMGV